MNIPHHVALIPDGNRRWAKDNNLPSFEGHRRGLNAILEISKKAKEMKIDVLTIWGFSTENWDRAKDEVNYLMILFVSFMDSHLKQALADETRLIHIGRKDRIPSILKKKIIEAEEKTKNHSKRYLVIALDYGGRDELLRAIAKIQKAGKPVDAKTIHNYLDTKDLPYPEPDLIIRTSGEKRTSGFMTWQSQYAEYIFTEKHLPAFTPSDFEECIVEYNSRKRRFGK